jgi:hypothetical protein
MHTGIVNLFCPVCGTAIRYDQNKPRLFMHHKEFGVVCGKECHDAAEVKYALMVLGRDEPER